MPPVPSGFPARHWRRAVAAWAVCALVAYGMVYCDLWLRARAACREGEKYLEWNLHPGLKAAGLDRTLAVQTARLQAQQQAGSITPQDLDRRLALARFARDESMRESSLKYAYVWFQTAAELFSPPESRWVLLSRKRMPEARRLWKAELDSRHVRYQDYMLE